MDIKYLYYFAEIIKEGNMTRAAYNLHIAQPALSATIDRAEKELDVKLFEKDGRNIIPSAYALEILPYVNNIIAQYTAIQNEIQRLKNPAVHHLNIAVTGISFPHRLLVPFRKKNPDIIVSQKLFNPTQFIDTVMSPQVDCVVSAYPFSDNRIQSLSLWDEKILVVVPNDHRFAFRQSLSVSELRNENFIMLPQEHAFRILCEKMCTDADFVPFVTMECFPGQTLSLISAGFGISFMTSAAIQAESFAGSNTCAIPLSDPSSVRHIQLLWKKNKTMSDSANRFIRFATKEFSN